MKDVLALHIIKRWVWISLGFVLLFVGVFIFWLRVPQRITANFFYTKGLEQFRRNRMPESELLFSKTLSWNPRHVGAAEYLVLLAAPRGNHEETLRRFEYARAIGSTAPHLIYIAASLHLSLGHLSQARQILEEGILSNANSGQALSALQSMLEEIRRIEEVRLQTKLQTK